MPIQLKKHVKESANVCVKFLDGDWYTMKKIKLHIWQIFFTSVFLLASHGVVWVLFRGLVMLCNWKTGKKKDQPQPEPKTAVNKFAAGYSKIFECSDSYGDLIDGLFIALVVMTFIGFVLMSILKIVAISCPRTYTWDFSGDMNSSLPSSTTGSTSSEEDSSDEEDDDSSDEDEDDSSDEEDDSSQGNSPTTIVVTTAPTNIITVTQRHSVPVVVCDFNNSSSSSSESNNTTITTSTVGDEP